MAPPTYVLCIGSGSEAGYFSPVRLVHSSLIFFLQISVLKLNSTLHYQIFKFDIVIQMLVWIFDSTYRKGEILMQKWHVTSHLFTVTCHTTCGVGVAHAVAASCMSLAHELQQLCRELACYYTVYHFVRHLLSCMRVHVWAARVDCFVHHGTV